MFTSPRHWLLPAFCLALLCVVASASAQTDEAIVASLFPPSLIDGNAPHLSAFARADLDGTGVQDAIVAVYGNGYRGAVRVIRAGQVAGESSYDLMAGAYPILRLADLDGDGKPEIVASFGTEGGEVTWPLKWSAGRLTLIGPSTTLFHGGVQATLGYAELFDLDGDGKLELVEYIADRPTHSVLKLGADGRYTRTSTKAVYAGHFVRHDGDPEIFTGVFPAAPGAKVTLSVVNGSAGGANRTTSADLYFNGKQLLFPNDFKKVAATFTLTATSAADGVNEIEVGMQGKPGSEVTVSASVQP